MDQSKVCDNKEIIARLDRLTLAFEVLCIKRDHENSAGGLNAYTEELSLDSQQVLEGVEKDLKSFCILFDAILKQLKPEQPTRIDKKALRKGLQREQNPYFEGIRSKQLKWFMLEYYDSIIKIADSLLLNEDNSRLFTQSFNAKTNAKIMSIRRLNNKCISAANQLNSLLTTIPKVNKEDLEADTAEQADAASEEKTEYKAKTDFLKELNAYKRKVKPANFLPVKPYGLFELEEHRDNLRVLECHYRKLLG